MRIHHSTGWVALLAFIILLPAAGYAGEGHGQYLARRDSIALGLGDASQSNTTIHTIDPWPRYAKDYKLEFDGQRMDLGITRYQANESIEPEGLTTQSVIDTSSGSGG